MYILQYILVWLFVYWGRILYFTPEWLKVKDLNNNSAKRVIWGMVLKRGGKGLGSGREK